MKKEVISKVVKIFLSLIIMILTSLFVKIDYLKIVLIVISYLLVGFDVIKEALEGILKKDFFNENILMTVATIGAIIIGKYDEAIAVMVLFNIGEIFEDVGESKSQKSIEKLMEIKSEFANVESVDGSITKKKPEEVKVGETIIVKPGEKIPLDGIVVEGNSTVNMSALTGESLPQEVKENDEVYSGTINLNKIITVKVTKPFEDSTVSKIIELVKNSAEKKTKTEKTISKFSGIYTKIVFLFAIGIIVYGLILENCKIIESIYKALTFLVISCPCALVISVPLTYFAGIGGASKKGILIKGTNYIDTITGLKTIVFDKTGTLTKGEFKAQEVIPNGISKDELIEISALAEYYSNHPISNAIKELYKKKIDTNRISDYEEVSGKGIKCKIDGKDVLVGNIKLMNDENIEKVEEDNDENVFYIAKENKYIGKIKIADEVKKNIKNVLANLRKVGIERISMLTGDKEKEAKKIAKQLNIDDVHYELLPEDKVKELEKIMEKSNGKVAFVGDGINDSPVLARADLGIAMGGLGSDSAIEASDVVIMRDDLSKIREAIKTCKKTANIAKENIIFSISVKIVFLILSLLGIASMWMAVFADVGVTIIAILNSLRALR